ncbi:MAG: hypothetical protein WCC48_11970, partial [Anaeromyxobacteraceae bacterium]
MAAAPHEIKAAQPLVTRGLEVSFVSAGWSRSALSLHGRTFMADQRSVLKEYRLLEQKRQSGPLTPQEEARLTQLRDLVGPEAGVGASKPGFDVNAAAARLRESLLPGGLR